MINATVFLEMFTWNSSMNCTLGDCWTEGFRKTGFIK